MIVSGVAEDAPAEIDVVKNESAKIAVENLAAKPTGEKIVIVRKIAEVQLAKPLLERNKTVQARRASRGIRADEGRLLGIGVVDIDDRLQTHRPMPRLKNRFTFEQVHRQRKIVL